MVQRREPEPQAKRSVEQRFGRRSSLKRTTDAPLAVRTGLMVIFPPSTLFHSSGTAAKMSINLGSAFRPCCLDTFWRIWLRLTSGGGLALDEYAWDWALWFWMSWLTIWVQTSR